jgi:hypothetical protein
MMQIVFAYAFSWEKILRIYFNPAQHYTSLARNSFSFHFISKATS